MLLLCEAGPLLHLHRCCCCTRCWQALLGCQQACRQHRRASGSFCRKLRCVRDVTSPRRPRISVAICSQISFAKIAAGHCLRSKGSDQDNLFGKEWVGMGFAAPSSNL
jgi:hypothetical protein